MTEKLLNINSFVWNFVLTSTHKILLLNHEDSFKSESLLYLRKVKHESNKFIQNFLQAKNIKADSIESWYFFLNLSMKNLYLP